MVIEYNIDPADFRAFVVSVASGGSTRTSRGFVSSLVRSFILWCVIGIVASILYNVVVGRPPAWMRPAISGFVVGSLVCGGIVAFMQTTSRKRAAPREDGNVLGHHSLEIGAEGIAESGPNYCGAMRWEGIVEVRDTSDHIFLMTDACAGYIVPKRVFATPADQTAFMDEIRAYRGQT